MTNKEKGPILGIDNTILGTSYKIEGFYQKFSKIINILLIAIAGIVALYFAYKYWILEPQEREAETAVFQAQNWFESDSFDLALNGQGDKLGFLAIADEFGATEAGNLSHYYAGICYMNKKEFENAIEQLEDFDTDNEMIGPMAEGLLGDANSEINDMENALKHYLNAANMVKNNLTTPMFLKKAALVCEEQKEFGKALSNYQRIKNDFPRSKEFSDIDKYIARANAANESN